MRLIPVLVAILLIGLEPVVTCHAQMMRPGAQGVPQSVSVEPVEPSLHQDSATLTRVVSAVLPVDGLVNLQWALRLAGIDYETAVFRPSIDMKDLLFRCEYGVRPRLQVSAELPVRSWSGGKGHLPASGFGLGDASWRLVYALPPSSARFNWAIVGGTTLPTGSEAEGLTEGVVSSRAGLAITSRFWSVDKNLPEMRLHLNLGYRWNGNERQGYGVGHSTGLQPWFPRYPALTGEDDHRENDFLMIGTAIEFRKELTALWVEYTEARLQWSDTVPLRENQRLVSAGLRFGRTEGWALHMAFEVSLALDDDATDFYPAYPDLTYCAGVSYQIPAGGSDRDRDGIPDRCDHCPDEPEDRDGWLDSDGCPEYDNDGDGIRDGIDEAPNEPEDFDGWEDEDGRPDPDNDGDGIPDRLDPCPNEAEDFDGYRDGDGCPDEFSDTDGDGIIDEEDGCPEEPEDLDGFEDEDGCPELDNDLDGIADSVDLCPNEPETYNGIDDDDGCPD